MAEKQENETVENIIAFSVIIVIGILIIGFWNSWWGWFDDAPETDNPIVTTPASGEPAKGSDDAPITIVEYGDFQCPFCQRWYSEVLPLLEEKYIDTGRVRLVFKQYPLARIHDRALPAAIASECMYRQENFWEYHDLLFESDGLDDESLYALAEQAGANMTQFKLCYDSNSTRPEVDADFAEGTRSGVTGTPAFVIGRSNFDVRGELIVGAQPIEVFDAIIERAS